MSALVEIIGFAAQSAGLALFSVLPGLFEPKKDQTSVVKLVLGSTLGDLSSSLSGNVPGVALWDERGRSIGTTPGTSEILGQGNFVNIEVVANSEVGNIRPSYISISNGGDDAICVAGFTITFPDDTKAAWNGDVAAACGGQTFESVTEFGEDRHKPRCVWIDRNRSLGLKHQGFGLHIGDFFGNQAQLDAYNSNVDILCKSGPRFRMYESLRAEDPILIYKPALEYNEDFTDKDLSKVIENPGVFADQDEDALRKVCTDPSTCKDLTAARCGVFQPPPGGRGGGGCLGRKQERELPETALTNSSTRLAPALQSQSSIPTNRPFDGSLVISAFPEHSARNLCNDENSWGPSFVATSENLFCDMENKALYDLCSDGHSSCCFDLQKTQLRPCYGNSVRRGRIPQQSVDGAQTYWKISRWGMDTSSS